MNILKKTTVFVLCFSSYICLAKENKSFLDMNTIFNTIPSSDTKKSFEVKDQGEKLEIVVHVPHVENSEDIRAQASNGRLKVIIPQKTMLTKIVVDQQTVKKIDRQQMEKKHQSKTLQSFSFSASRQVQYAPLPFPVDIPKQNADQLIPPVEYKNDIVTITLNKVKENKAIIAQPRTITVINK